MASNYFTKKETIKEIERNVATPIISDRALFLRRMLNEKFKSWVNQGRTQDEVISYMSTVVPFKKWERYFSELNIRFDDNSKANSNLLKLLSSNRLDYALIRAGEYLGSYDEDMIPLAAVNNVEKILAFYIPKGYTLVKEFGGEDIFNIRFGVGFAELLIDAGKEIAEINASFTLKLKSKCIDCGEEFFIGIDQFIDLMNKGLILPKRCKNCRNTRKLNAMANNITFYAKANTNK